MDQALRILFWLLAGLVVYTYLGYGLLLYLLLRLRKKKVGHPDQGNLPEVAFIIAAYNEEHALAEKLRNTNGLDYPMNKLRVILVADGSTDGTAALAAGQAGVQVSNGPLRQGKAAALNQGVSMAGDAEILVFSDANTLLNKDALLKLVRHYADPVVGAVSGEKKVISGDSGLVQAEGESIYWKYESFLKKMDSDFHTVVGAAGELLSVRRSCFTRIPEHVILDDFYLSLQVCRQGKVVRYEPEAMALETPSLTLADEKKRKTRISAGAFQAMVIFTDLLWPVGHPRLTFQYISHRVMRWVVCPLALPILLIINFLILPGASEPANIHSLTWAAQLVFYGLALTGWAMKGLSMPRMKFFYIPYYFLFMNMSVWEGFFKYVSKRQSVIWEKSNRIDSKNLPQETAKNVDSDSNFTDGI